MSYRPQPGDRDDAAGRQPPGWYPDPRSYIDPAAQRVLRWWDGTQWGQETRPMPEGGEQRPIAYPRQPYGRRPWPRRHMVLTVLGSLAALIIIVGGMASLGAKAKQADSASTVATTAPTRTVTPSRTPTHHAVSAKPVPAKAPVTTQSAAPAPATTVPTPVATVHAVPPAPVATVHAVTPPPAATTASGCYPLTNGGHCYEPGEYCRASDHGMSGVAGDGERIVCKDNDGWRWQPV